MHFLSDTKKRRKFLLFKRIKSLSLSLSSILLKRSRILSLGKLKLPSIILLCLFRILYYVLNMRTVWSNYCTFRHVVCCLRSHLSHPCFSTVCLSVVSATSLRIVVCAVAPCYITVVSGCFRASSRSWSRSPSCSSVMFSVCQGRNLPNKNIFIKLLEEYPLKMR